MPTYPEYPPNPQLAEPYHRSLKRVLDRLSTSLSRDSLIQQMTHSLRNSFQVDRVVLYYFYRHWEGQVTFEALSSEEYSIIGCTGPDQCFNGDYAALYLGGRIRAIADIEAEPIQDCHRDYLRSMRVRANLVAPIVTNQGLWGLILAHHCQSTRVWSDNDKEMIRRAAEAIATAPSVQ